MSLAYYRWAIARALEHCGTSCEGGIRARCEQIASALIEWKPEAQALLRDEVERLRLEIERGALDCLSHDALSIAWGCLAIHTGYRADTGYIDPALISMAGLVAYRRADAQIGRTLTHYQAEKAKISAVPKMELARNEAMEAERILCATKRQELGAEPYDAGERYNPARREVD